MFSLPVFYIPISLENFPPLFPFKIPSIPKMKYTVYQVIIILKGPLQLFE